VSDEYTSCRSAGDHVGGFGIFFRSNPPITTRICRNAERACMYAGDFSAINFRAYTVKIECDELTVVLLRSFSNALYPCHNVSKFSRGMQTAR
jgi:hypothetical protein